MGVESMSSRPLRVLHVAQPLDLGVPRVAGEFALDQIARGWRVAVACPPSSELRAATADAGVEWHSWPATRSPGPATIREARRLARIVAAVRPDLVHLHSAKAGLAGRLVLRGRLPTVFQPHSWSFEAVAGPLRALTIVWERSGARWADEIVCVSEDERERGEEVGVHARWAVIPNGVDLDRLRPADANERAAARARLGLSDAPLAVAIGRLFRQKGYDVLLDAWPRVRDEVARATLVIVGEGPEGDTLAARLTPGAELIGRQEDVALWLAAADVVVQPSRWEAGLTRVAMEAMARGRSVVGSDVAGTRAGLGPDAGAVVPVDAPVPLAEAIAARLASPEKADGEGRAGRLRVEHDFDLAVTLRRVAELYAGLTTRSTAAEMEQ